MENKTSTDTRANKGTIEIFGIKPTLELLVHISGMIEKWIEREQSLMFLPKISTYFVHLERQSFSRHFLCYFQVKIGSRQWQHQTSETSVPDALNATLKGLNTFHAHDPVSPERLFEHRSHLGEYPQYCDPEGNAFLRAKNTFSAAS